MEQQLTQGQTNPERRFGHTITMINKDRAIMFGGAVGDGVYRITNDTFSFDCKTCQWIQMMPRNKEDSPTPRAAHSSTVVETNQLVIFGGAQSHGNLVDNDLYLLKLSQSESNGKWVKVPVNGEKPSARYGHCMVFFKPFILLIGGNIGNEPSNDVWQLSIEKSPFVWRKIDFNQNTMKLPSPRVYHAATIWKSDDKGDMVLLFGGRNKQQQALNDLYGLRRHNNGVWDWLEAPNKGAYSPVPRYQHQILCSQDMVIVVGGRNNNSQTQSIPIDIYNLSKPEWFNFNGINRFRHVSWLSFKNLYTHGGFENKQPNLPINALSKIDLSQLLESYPDLQKNIEVPFDKTSKGKGLYEIDQMIQIGQYQNNQIFTHYIKRRDLTQENIKLIESEQADMKEENVRSTTLYQTVLKYLLKPKEYQYTPNQSFPINTQIMITLCKEVIKVLEKEAMVVELNPGVKIFGSIHGQFGDLMRFFNQYGTPDNDQSIRNSDIESQDYLFLGNYVDRGKCSLEVIMTLFALKLKFPNSIYLLRGAHEDRNINQDEGLGLECHQRLGDDIQNPNSVFNKINEVFDYLPLAAVLNNEILCVHSGIGTNINQIKDLNQIKKPFVLKLNENSPQQKMACDILWSDPVKDINSTKNEQNNRDYISKNIVRFGTDRIRQFMNDNNLQIILRSHECVLNGVEIFGNTKLYTIFSCTNYGGTAKNQACIFHYHNRTKQLVALDLDCDPSYTHWYEPKELKVTQNDQAFFNPQDRPITPPRPSGNYK